MKRRSTYVAPRRARSGLDAGELFWSVVLALAFFGALYGGLALVGVYGSILGAP